MPKITKIRTQKKAGRYNIYLDDEYAFAVGETILVQQQLIKGMILSAEQVESLKQADQRDVSLNKALHYLSYQMRSQHELRQYLNQQEFDVETIDWIIQKLQEQGYLDDQNYANSFVRTEIKTSLDGPKQIQHKLQQKKISPTIIQTALTIYTPDLQEQTASKLAQKVWRQNKRQPIQKRTQKIKQKLILAGFDDAAFEQALAQLPDEEDTDFEQELLVQTAQKLWARYQDKPQGRSKLYAALLRRGFASADIQSCIENLQK